MMLGIGKVTISGVLSIQSINRLCHGLGMTWASSLLGPIPGGGGWLGVSQISLASRYNHGLMRSPSFWEEDSQTFL